MKSIFFVPIAVMLLAGGTNGPSVPNEQLTYSINWPSGLGLGESQLHGALRPPSEGTKERMTFGFELDAAVPGFTVADKFSSTASGDFCSTEFEKNTHHGQKRVEEKTTFEASTATRETKGGGHTKMDTSVCAKDALTYLYFVRHELSQGRLPQPATVYFGAPYQVRMEFTGTESIRVGDKQVQTDHLTGSVKGQVADAHFDIYFLKDASRTPALVKLPLSLGTFSMELVK
jgi:Protein of unknown function (DUF3108)